MMKLFFSQFVVFHIAGSKCMALGYSLPVRKNFALKGAHHQS